jgi:8-hydroxy-5-deazaflavin:NADPH oxidoreductase
MKIGVLGAGRMAEALVPHWLAAGHEVTIGGRTPAKAKELAQRLGARAVTLREAAEDGEALLLAVLHEGVERTLADAGAADGTMAGKVLLDCTNPVETERFTLVTTAGPSLAERVAEATGARVVKAFNLAYSEVWRRRARYDGRPLRVPLAGEADAQAVAGPLVRAVGAEPLDVGELEQAHHLEAMAAIVIRLLMGGADPFSTFQLSVGVPEAS